MRWLALTGFTLTLILFIGEIAVFVSRLFVNTDYYLDPFAPYADMMPGQPTAALNQYPCQFEKGLDRDVEPTRCRIQPNNGDFSEVVALINGGQIVQITFKTKTLHVGDLVERWGSPDVIDHRTGSIYLQWRGGSIYAVISPDTRTRLFSYMLPVYSIILSV